MIILQRDGWLPLFSDWSRPSSQRRNCRYNRIVQVCYVQFPTDRRKRMITRVLALSFFVAIALSATVEAHSGGTNSDGCHNDNIHGGYHCHNAPTPSSSGNSTISAGLSYVPAFLCGNGLSLWLSPLSLGLVGLHSRFRMHTGTRRMTRTR